MKEQFDVSQGQLSGLIKHVMTDTGRGTLKERVRAGFKWLGVQLGCKPETIEFDPIDHGIIRAEPVEPSPLFPDAPTDPS